MAKKQLEIMLGRVDNVVYMQVLRQERINFVEYTAKIARNAMFLASEEYPELSSDGLYVAGTDKSSYKRVARRMFPSNEDAIAYCRNVATLVRKFNDRKVRTPEVDNKPSAAWNKIKEKTRVS